MAVVKVDWMVEKVLRKKPEINPFAQNLPRRRIIDWFFTMSTQSILETDVFFSNLPSFIERNVVVINR